MEILWKAVYILLFAIFGNSTEEGGNKPSIRSLLRIYTTLHWQMLITTGNWANASLILEVDNHYMTITLYCEKVILFVHIFF